MTFEAWWAKFTSNGEVLYSMMDFKRCWDTAHREGQQSMQQRCAALLREHICNYCDHDHAEDMAQLVLEGTP